MHSIRKYQQYAIYTKSVVIIPKIDKVRHRKNEDKAKERHMNRQHISVYQSLLANKDINIYNSNAFR